MNIGEAAQRTGLSAKTIRYYESVDLIAANRDQNGYRNFSEKEIKQLMFIRRLRNLGFTLADCQMLVSALGDNSQSEIARNGNDIATKRQLDSKLRLLLVDKLDDVDSKLKELVGLRSSIKQSIDDVQTQTAGSEFIRLLNRAS